MKKIVLLSLLVILLCGCTSIQTSSLNQIMNNSFNSKMKTTNKNRNGYRYYLPKGLNVKKSSEFNEVLTDQKYNYYLYVDIVSYHAKKADSYTTNQNAYYSEKLYYNNKFGYIEINNYKNNQYLIEIMYNYAKIEVVAYEKDINLCVSYATSILSSIAYNNNVIKNYLEENVLDFKEEGFDIFEIIGREEYLEFKEEETNENVVKDPDYIK